MRDTAPLDQQTCHRGDPDRVWSGGSTMMNGRTARTKVWNGMRMNVCPEMIDSESVRASPHHAKEIEDHSQRSSLGSRAVVQALGIAAAAADPSAIAHAHDADGR